MREGKEMEGKSPCLVYGLSLLPLFSTQHFPLVLQISLENVNLQYFTWMWERHWPCYAERRRNPYSACSAGATFKELRKLEWSLCWDPQISEGSEIYLPSMLISEPAVVSWMQAKATRYLGLRKKMLLLTAIILTFVPPLWDPILTTQREPGLPEHLVSYITKAELWA